MKQQVDESLDTCGIMETQIRGQELVQVSVEDLEERLRGTKLPLQIHFQEVEDSSNWELC